MERQRKHSRSAMKGKRLARPTTPGKQQQKQQQRSLEDAAPGNTFQGCKTPHDHNTVEGKKPKRPSRRSSFRLSWRRRRRPAKTCTEEDDAQPAARDSQPPHEEKATVASRVRKLFGGSFRRRKAQPAAEEVVRGDAKPGAAEELRREPALPFVQRDMEDGTAYWSLHDEMGEVRAIQLTAIATSDLSQLELDALKSFAMDKLPGLLPSIDSWMELQSTAKPRRSSSITGFLKMFGKSKSEYNSGALDPTQVITRRHTGRSRLKSATSERSSSDSARVFGRALEELIAQDRRTFHMQSLRVPFIVHSTCEYIRDNGLTVHGIFRVTGAARRIRMLNEACEAGERPDYDGISPADVTSVLKYFLRQMPEPLLTSYLYQAFLDVPRLPSEDQLRALRLLCSLLPVEHLEVLRVLLSLLNDIAIRAHEEKSSEMDSHNLAVVMAPNILRKPPADANSHTQKHRGRSRSIDQRTLMLTDEASRQVDQESYAVELVEMLIDYNDHIFVVPPNLRDEVLQHHQHDSPNMVLMIITALVRAQARLLPPSPPSTPTVPRESIGSIPSTPAATTGSTQLRWSSSLFAASATPSRMQTPESLDPSRRTSGSAHGYPGAPRTPSVDITTANLPQPSSAPLPTLAETPAVAFPPPPQPATASAAERSLSAGSVDALQEADTSAMAEEERMGLGISSQHEAAAHQHPPHPDSHPHPPRHHHHHHWRQDHDDDYHNMFHHQHSQQKRGEFAEHAQRVPGLLNGHVGFQDEQRGLSDDDSDDHGNHRAFTFSARSSADASGTAQSSSTATYSGSDSHPFHGDSQDDTEEADASVDDVHGAETSERDMVQGLEEDDPLPPVSAIARVPTKGSRQSYMHAVRGPHTDSSYFSATAGAAATTSTSATEPTWREHVQALDSDMAQRATPGTGAADEADGPLFRELAAAWDTVVARTASSDAREDSDSAVTPTPTPAAVSRVAGASSNLPFSPDTMIAYGPRGRPQATHTAVPEQHEEQQQLLPTPTKQRRQPPSYAERFGASVSAGLAGHRGGSGDVASQQKRHREPQRQEHVQPATRRRTVSRESFEAALHRRQGDGSTRRVVSARKPAPPPLTHVRNGAHPNNSTHDDTPSPLSSAHLLQQQQQMQRRMQQQRQQQLLLLQRDARAAPLTGRQRPGRRVLLRRASGHRMLETDHQGTVV